MEAKTPPIQILDLTLYYDHKDKVLERHKTVNAIPISSKRKFLRYSRELPESHVAKGRCISKNRYTFIGNRSGGVKEWYGVAHVLFSCW